MGSALTPSRSLLYEIQRALYGQSGSPSSSRALLPFLWSAYGFTNDIASVLAILDGTENGSYSLSDFLADNEYSATYIEGSDYSLSVLRTFFENVYTTDNGLDDAAYPYPAFSVYDAVLESVYNTDVPSYDGSALTVYDPVNESMLLTLHNDAQAVKWSIEGLAGAVNEPSSFVVSNVVTDIGGGEIDQSAFGYSGIGSLVSGYATQILTNRLSDSVFAVNTNSLASVTNVALPSMDPFLSWAESSVNFATGVPHTDPSITLFSSFEHAGIRIPGMILDLSDPRISLLQTKCHALCTFIYAALAVFLCVFRVKSFLEYVTQGFALTYGDSAMEAGNSLGQSDSGDKPFGGAM